MAGGRHELVAWSIATTEHCEAYTWRISILPDSCREHRRGRTLGHDLAAAVEVKLGPEGHEGGGHLQHGRLYVARRGVDAREEALVVEVAMVAEVAIGVAQVADCLLVQVHVHDRDDPMELVARHVPPVCLVEVREHRLHLAAALAHERSNLELDPTGLGNLRRAQPHRVSASRGGVLGARHLQIGQRVQLQALPSEGFINLLDKCLIFEEAIVLQEHREQGLEVVPVDLLAQVQNREDGLDLPGRASPLAQSVEVLELLLKADALLDNLGLDSLDNADARVGPLRIVGPEVQGARREGLRGVRQHLRDLVVHGHEVHVTTLRSVLVAQQLDVTVGHLLLEGEVALELLPRDLAAPPRVEHGGRGGRGTI
mmetsp:Transcript_74905/g.195078  ORF Transcript_74905/g.195078 Transcript_74905/m.195078 type:complete len:370 (-) Transcript_74905:359-1468(-)